MEPWLSTIHRRQTSVWSSWNGSFLWSACSWTIWSTLQKHFKCQKEISFPKVPGNPKFKSFVNVTQSQFLLQSGTSCITADSRKVVQQNRMRQCSVCYKKNSPIQKANSLKWKMKGARYSSLMSGMVLGFSCYPQTILNYQKTSAEANKAKVQKQIKEAIKVRLFTWITLNDVRSEEHTSELQSR